MSGIGIYGLSGSGIDVDSMVRMGMMGKQNQYDKMYKEEVKNEWVKEAYTSMYSSLNTFNSSTLYNYKLSSTTSPMSASSSQSTVATAVANADAAIMSHTVNVSQLASNAYLLTADKIARKNQDLSESIYLKDILFSSEEQSDLRNGIPTDPDEAEKYLDKELLSFDIADGIESTSKKKTISFTYREIMDNNLTVNDLASRINQSGVNIKAAYDSANDAFSLYQKDGGVNNKIMLTVKNEGLGSNVPVTSAAGNGARLLNNLQMASVTQSEDENHNLISKLSDKFTVQLATGVSAIGGAQTSYTSQNVVGESTTLDSLFTASKDDTNNAPIKFKLISTSEDGSTTYEKEISLDASKTIEDLMTAIDAAGDDGVAHFSASRDPSGHLSFTAADSGYKLSMQVASGDDSVAAENGRYLLNALSFTGIADKGDALTHNTTGLALKNDDGSYTQGASGVSAEVTIDGRKYTSETSKISVGNVTYSLASIGATTVTVSQDTDKLIENVKKFVEDYNKMLDELNNKYYEEKYSDYGVLTQTQEKGMTKEQIDKWNEKAKSGLLNHNQTIGKIISEMREALYTPVDGATGKYNTMMSIGITSSTDRGHLTLDEEKLKKALAAEPDCVREIFNSDGDYKDKNGEIKTDYSKQGVIGRISDSLYKNLKTMKSYAGTTTETADGSSLGDLIRELQTKMSNFKTMMKSYENLLYKKYDAMEIAIQRMSVSMGYITGGQ
ncbi:flagellar hook-associated protein 2 [Selenomonas ruminantium]|uniref:Flagellar hook-associated protein 2 n=1 Tax=Selenomonas ruminantium TaxID=971 RepID=A0A1M6UMJ2_SELRU|nr:flagellar filament capping protein FliD [Selenomonas ruminantium]SHK70391.1 flagellar hook-associated protein 2 [Selenomonas ruminantium]